MSKSLSLDLIKSFQAKVENDKHTQLSMNSAVHNDITKLAMKWDNFRKIDHKFFVKYFGLSIYFSHFNS